MPTFVLCPPADEEVAELLLAALDQVREFAADGEGYVLRGDGPEIHLVTKR